MRSWSTSFKMSGYCLFAHVVRLCRFQYDSRRLEEMMDSAEIGLLNETIVNCVKCPRLVHHREETARVKRRMYRNEEYWGRPLTGYGDVDARLPSGGIGPGCPRRKQDGGACSLATGAATGCTARFISLVSLTKPRPSTGTTDSGSSTPTLLPRSVARLPTTSPAGRRCSRAGPYLETELRALSAVKVVVPLGENRLRLLPEGET